MRHADKQVCASGLGDDGAWRKNELLFSWRATFLPWGAPTVLVVGPGQESVWATCAQTLGWGDTSSTAVPGSKCQPRTSGLCWEKGAANRLVRCLPMGEQGQTSFQPVTGLLAPAAPRGCTRTSLGYQR